MSKVEALDHHDLKQAEFIAGLLGLENRNPGHEIYFFEPDPNQPSTLEGWNRSEFLSAIGQDWLTAVDSKTKKTE